jgi:hypothetical protein
LVSNPKNSKKYKDLMDLIEINEKDNLFEKIEEEMGDILDSEDLFSLEGLGRKRSRQPTPRVDETLYDL